jgi:DNA (cytosine-5)-methyltransferase 1
MCRRGGERHLAQPRNIIEYEPGALLREWGLHGLEAELVDVLVGGPPCQAFARVGRAKLREVASHPGAYLKDPRGDLCLRFLHYVRELQPVALLMENVPDVLNYGGHNIADEMCEVLSELGYNCRYTFLNAAFYGAPEMRERVFLLAYAQEVGSSPAFPECTHYVRLPRGYDGSRQVAMQTIDTGLFADQVYFTHSPVPDASAASRPLTAWDPLADLPPVFIGN